MEQTEKSALEKTGIVYCRNCETRFTGKFCSHCGQKYDDREIDFRFFWHDVQHGLLHFDKGILFTLKELLTRPGYTIRDYIDGKRVRHFKPLSFLIVLGGIYGIMSHYFDEKITLAITTGSDIKEFFDPAVIAEWIRSHYAIYSLALVPLYSLCTFLAFRKEKYNYFHHIIINSYISGISIFVSFVMFPVIFLFKKFSIDITDVTDLTGTALTVWTLMQLFQHLKKKTRIKKIFLSYVYLWILFLLLIAALFGILSFWVKYRH